MNRSMKRVATIVLGLAVAVLTVTAIAPTSPTPTATAASSDYFLKLDGIDGESRDPGHPGTIQVESWSWGVSNMGTGGHGGGGGAGKSSFTDLTIKKRIDKGVALLKACATGEHIKSAKLFVTRKSADGSNEDYYKITLSDVTCTSLQQAGTASDEPTESVTFSYQKIEWEYLPQGSSTWMKAGYDVKMQKGI